MKTSRRLARLAITLWCVALFLPAWELKGPQTGWMGLTMAACGSVFIPIAIVLFWPPLFANYAVWLAAFNLAGPDRALTPRQLVWFGVSIAITLGLYGHTLLVGGWLWIASLLIGLASQLERLRDAALAERFDAETGFVR